MLQIELSQTKAVLERPYCRLKDRRDLNMRNALVTVQHPAYIDAAVVETGHDYGLNVYGRRALSVQDRVAIICNFLTRENTSEREGCRLFVQFAPA